MVGQLALELLLRDRADLGRPVGLDRDVDRLPPLGIGPRVGERLQHRLRGASTSHSSMNTYSEATLSIRDYPLRISATLGIVDGARRLA